MAALLLALTFRALEIPVFWRPDVALGWAPAFASVTVILAMVLLATLWPARESAMFPRAGRWPVAAFSAALAVTLAGLAVTFSRWVSRLILLPIDAHRADMLVQIGLAIERLRAGRDPYFVYHVPWELPLSYGPWLWMWFVAPRALHADLRLMTAFGQLFVSALTGLGAALAVRIGRHACAVILLGLAWTVLQCPLFDEFVVIGHTPAYWPLLATFALLSARGSHQGAAVLLGMLVAARTPMAALVPVFLMHLWQADRALVGRAAALLGATVALSFAPFALWDWRVLAYGLYGNYVRVIKQFVWTQTPWMDTTLGLTRVLLNSGHPGLVGPSQFIALAGVYLLAWRALGRGRRPGPWFCLALLAFYMTTLWPVWYVFLDVFLLGVCCLVADEVPAIRAFPWRTVTATAALVVVAMGATLAWNPGIYYAVEAGRPSRGHFRDGFGPDEAEGARRYVWAASTAARVQLPRGVRGEADLQIECDPVIGEDAAPLLRATLNGADLGQRQLRAGWQVVSFRATRQAWRIVDNELVLSFVRAGSEGAGSIRAARIAKVTIAPPGSAAPAPP